VVKWKVRGIEEREKKKENGRGINMRNEGWRQQRREGVGRKKEQDTSPKQFSWTFSNRLLLK
jgi:hypothetical protein